MIMGFVIRNQFEEIKLYIEYDFFAVEDHTHDVGKEWLVTSMGQLSH